VIFKVFLSLDAMVAYRAVQSVAAYNPTAVLVVCVPPDKLS